MSNRLIHSVRTSLLHAKQKWPAIISSALWPFWIGPPKWDPRSRVLVYLGHSPHHAGNVAQVLNLQTGHVSQQYHLVLDDKFTTVPYIDSAETPLNWTTLVAECSEWATDEAFTITST
eukprot:14643395-Ditylum_brightwellii.AAC.1